VVEFRNLPVHCQGLEGDKSIAMFLNFNRSKRQLCSCHKYGNKSGKIQIPHPALSTQPHVMLKRQQRGLVDTSSTQWPRERSQTAKTSCLRPNVFFIFHKRIMRR